MEIEKETHTIDTISNIDDLIGALKDTGLTEDEAEDLIVEEGFDF